MFKKNSAVKINKNVSGLVRKFRNMEKTVVFKNTTPKKVLKFIRDLASAMYIFNKADYTALYSCGCGINEYAVDYGGSSFNWIFNDLIKDILRCKNGVEVRTKITSDGSFESYIDVSIWALDEECPDCTALREEVKKMRPDSLLQQAVYSHGLATGFGANLVKAEVAEANLRKLTSLRGKEICCAWKNQQIGGFGCFVQGEVTVASNKDLWSFVARDGSRKFNLNENIEYLIERKEDIDFSVCDHTEFFVIPQKLVGFWAKEWFVRSVAGGRELVEKLRKEGYKVWITAARHK